MSDTDGSPAVSTALPAPGDMTYEELVDAGYEAMIHHYLEPPYVDWIVVEILNNVTEVVRRRFGLGAQDAELLFADARSEAYRRLNDVDLDDYVDHHKLIKAIAEYLTEEDVA